MTDFLNNPYCPERKISLAFIGKAPDEIVLFIESFSIELIRLNTNYKIDSTIENHADVNLFHMKRGVFSHDVSQTEILKKFFKAGGAVRLLETDVSGSYPNDCKLNFALVGNNLFGKMNVLDESIKAFGISNGWNFINVNQGYAKCSTCIVNDRSIITDDICIHRAANENGLDSLLIEKGDIYLSDKHYGFIGGASALIDKNHLLFFGDIRKHRSFEKIDSYLNEHNCKYDYIENYPLTDIGGIVPVY